MHGKSYKVSSSKIKIKTILSYDVTSDSDITPCIKIDRTLVVYIFSNIM